MQRFKNLPNKWKILSVVLFIVFVSTWGLVGFVIGRKSASAPPVGTFKNENILPEFAEVASPINGILYTKTESENWKTKLPLAVVIENHTDTRPQSGLNKADVIYEALAEGGITRFLVIFLLELGFLGTFGYDVRWVYDRKPNSYKRFIGGAKHTDAEDGKQITAKTVVVQYASVSPDSSGHGRGKIQTIGGGKVQDFKNGVVVSGTWRKKSRTDRTRFLDSSGKEISLNRGKIWIEVVPSGSQVSISK